MKINHAMSYDKPLRVYASIFSFCLTSATLTICLLSKVQMRSLSEVEVSLITPAQAQITPDNTLGAESSRLTPNILINNANADRIDGGAQRGSNLFHSFTQFNINDGQRVYFGNPVGVQNILTRVTGGQGSNILGTLGVNGNANLFLINPNGILFGKNARLDVRGSFVATTANAVQFGNQGIFSATNPQAPPLLTINPSALLFNQINQNAAIQNNSIAPAGENTAGFEALGLRVPDGKSLLLVGGNVSLDGGRLNAFGGRVELGGLAESGNVNLLFDGDNLKLGFPENITRADVSLSNQAAVYVEAAGGGNIAINARKLEILGGSGLYAGIGEGLGTSETVAGDIILNAIGEIKLASESFIFNDVRLGAKGNGGNITIDSGSFSLQDGAQLAASTFGQGNAGNIAINARDTISFDNGFAFSTVESTGIGNGGNLNLTTGSLSLTNGGVLDASTLGQGNAGSITINARDTISFDNGSAISSVDTTGIGNGGNLNLTTDSLFLTNGTQLAAATLGQGNAGNIIINARDTISFDNGFAFSTVDTTGIGNGGNINVTTGSLSLTNGTQLAAATLGQGNAGNITIDARDTISFDNGFAFSTVDTTGIGNGGNINVTTGSLSLTNGAQLAADTLGQGNAGNITIDARDTISFDNGFASSTVQSTGIGNGGNINVTTDSLSLTNGAQLAAATFGQGNAGNITIDARDTVSFDNGFAFSIVDTTGIGNGGNINVTTGSLSLTNGTQLAAATRGQGNAGNITIDARDTVSFDNGSAFSTVDTTGIGNGGNINVTTGSLSLTNGAQLAAATLGQGNAGNIIINARDTISFDNGSAVSFVNTTGIGNGGNINVTTDSLSLTNGAQLIASTFGQGNAGNITIDARDTISFDGISNTGWISGAFSNVESTGIGNGGNINLTTGSLSLTNSGKLAAGTVGQGNAGNITINARDTVSFDNGFAVSTVESTGIGNGGNINVTTGSLSLTNSAELAAVTRGQGNAGNITINASDTISFDGTSNNGFPSGAFSNVESTGIGNGGNINLTTGSLSLTNGGLLIAATFGQGNAGNITINARDTISFDGTRNNGFPSGAFTSVELTGIGNGGNIFIHSETLNLNNGAVIYAQTTNGQGGNIDLQLAGLLLLRRGALISTTAGITQAGGDGGNIIIDSPFIIAVANENNDISANAFTGKGGKVNISTQAIFGIEPRPETTNQSDITASSKLGVQGQITITQPQVQPPQKLIELPTGLVDASTKFAQICPRGRNAKPLGTFVVTGRGSLPPNSFEPLAGTTSLSPLATLDGENVDTKLQKNVETDAGNSAPIAEAQGLVKTADGNIMLVAQVPTATPAATSSSAMCPGSSLTR
ncbi:filamentous hemagglutinin outer membrane protein [Calothrix sp. NIES-2100]|uniref:beta strand repeat-containing protein n=1 Tax=Calothrix sp. NIES-2100 TaxID=1954172 RepID=UPI000B621294|nr:filamentous hemagglutinin outer membrane protein [Calothrix sp. NIES-2100]